MVLNQTEKVTVRIKSRYCCKSQFLVHENNDSAVCLTGNPARPRKRQGRFRFAAYPLGLASPLRLASTSRAVVAWCLVCPFPTYTRTHPADPSLFLASCITAIFCSLFTVHPFQQQRLILGNRKPATVTHSTHHSSTIHICSISDPIRRTESSFLEHAPALFLP